MQPCQLFFHTLNSEIRCISEVAVKIVSLISESLVNLIDFFVDEDVSLLESTALDGKYLFFRQLLAMGPENHYYSDHIT
jgi:hypothetical protein